MCNIIQKLILKSNISNMTKYQMSGQLTICEKCKKQNECKTYSELRFSYVRKYWITYYDICNC